MNKILEITDLSKTYGSISALDHVDLTIMEGEWVSIMGPSGSGKSTLLNVICGLDQPSLGSVKVENLELARLSQAELARYRREKAGLVFQQFYLVPYLNAVENVMLSQYFHSLPDKSEAGMALEEVGLGHRLDHLPSHLSGGEQQRVCIARALINEPSLLLADEPTGNLDEANENTVMQIFRKLHERGITLVVVTHDIKVGQAGDRIVYLEHGRIAGAPPAAAELDDRVLHGGAHTS